MARNPGSTPDGTLLTGPAMDDPDAVGGQTMGGTLNPGPYEWLGGFTDNWATAACWSPNGVPGAGDDVTIDRAGANPYYVNVTDARAVHAVTLTGANATLAIHGGGSLTLYGNVSNSQTIWNRQ